ncbi:MAG TPA: hypothetical protein PKU74_06695, partial [Candidatus Omnitrophota bacterium]|nr:hypothetical protein [Candidatus Omnitrophota bacterium]
MLYRAFIFILTTIVSLCCLPVAHARQDSEHNHAPMNEPFRGGEGVGETSGLNSDTADFKRGQSLSNSAVSVNELLGVDLEAEKQNMVKIKAAGQGESA